jgi:predicted acyltransferase
MQDQLASQPCANLSKLIDLTAWNAFLIHDSWSAVSKSISQALPPLQLISLWYFFTRVNAKIHLDSDSRKLRAAVCAGVITQKFPAAASVPKQKEPTSDASP